jgi:transposase
VGQPAAERPRSQEVLVANARKLRLIYGQRRKTDRLDAQNPARLARPDPKLLAPLKHRGETSQAHLAIVRSREVLIEARAKLINHVRGTVKSRSGLACPSAPRRPSTRRWGRTCRSL